MKESGIDVIVGLHEGSKSRDKAKADGLAVYSVSEAAASADIIQLLVPDETPGPSCTGMKSRYI